MNSHFCKMRKCFNRFSHSKEIPLAKAARPQKRLWSKRMFLENLGSLVTLAVLGRGLLVALSMARGLRKVELDAQMPKERSFAVCNHGFAFRKTFLEILYLAIFRYSVLRSMPSRRDASALFPFVSANALLIRVTSFSFRL